MKETPLDKTVILSHIQQCLTEIPSNGAKKGTLKKVLIIHPDYSRNDFTHIICPLLCQELVTKGTTEIVTLNAGGTHRKMTPSELEKKLGVSTTSVPQISNMLNHQFDDPDQLITATTLSREFIREQTSGNLDIDLLVDVNKIVTESFDAIFAISGTVPHEALGYSGGTKIFFPGISGPNVIAMLHWAAVLIGIPSIIGTVDNPAREVVNAGTKEIFKLIGDTSIVSLNMVYTEDENHNAVPRGLFCGQGFEGFRDAHYKASELSSNLHIIKLDRPMNRIVQQLPSMYDEVWTAGKGSYKLQKAGVLLEGGEIILLAPHIHCFHSNERMDADIRRIGYHGLEYVLEFCKKYPDFDKNIASHVINVRGFGKMINGMEHFPFKVTLATGIPEKECHEVGLDYLPPEEVVTKNYLKPEDLWISEGGQWLYSA